MNKRRFSPGPGARSRERGPSQRQLRVGEVLRHVLAELLSQAEWRDPGLAGRSITVGEVRVSPDLRHATCFVLPLGGEDGAAAVAALNRQAGRLAARAAGQLTTKYTPRLSFKLDESYAAGARIDALLRRADVARDLDDGESA